MGPNRGLDTIRTIASAGAADDVENSAHRVAYVPEPSERRVFGLPDDRAAQFRDRGQRLVGVVDRDVDLPASALTRRQVGAPVACVMIPSPERTPGGLRSRQEAHSLCIMYACR